jgi:hypothetical protein
MKFRKSVFPLFACVAIVFVSCYKDNVSHNSDISSLSPAILQTISAESITAIKQSYSLLSNIEKQKLWDTK